MSAAPLGRLEKVDPRQVWQNEAADFTPWLGREDNLRLLGDTIGLDLELEAQEQCVGPFRADLLCKDTVTGHWVLVENQLERTDHTHLGQLLTYAAGLQAVTVVWVSPTFTEEHRATLDWLNNITNEKFNFFGLEIELWRIGDSPCAPKFNVISKPNDWTKSISPPEPTSTQQVQLEYWAGLRDLLLERKGKIRPRKPFPGSFYDSAVGRSGFVIGAWINTRDTVISVALWIDNPEAAAFYQLLCAQREEIESEIGESLVWSQVEGRKARYVQLVRPDSDLMQRENWTELQKWHADKMELFYEVFHSRVLALSSSDYVPPEDQAHESPAE